MLNWNVCPTVHVNELESELEKAYPEENWDNLRNILFGDDYNNDSFMMWVFRGPMDYYDFFDTDKALKVNDYLDKTIPIQFGDAILIEVCW
jgi:hypothetical protein